MRFLNIVLFIHHLNSFNYNIKFNVFKLFLIFKVSEKEENLRNIVKKHNNIETAVVDVVEAPDNLKLLMQNSEVVVSLLPHPLHPSIADLCIDIGVNMVTASYCTDEMMKRHDK